MNGVLTRYSFAFDVRLGGLVSTWRFDLVAAPDGSGTEVVQSWQDHRGPARRRIGALTSGVRDRQQHNRETMRHTLVRLKAALEAAGPPSP
ncbi:hypothetical protein ACQEUX_16420 [Micromonospora sp. CA-259024]|uniref:hypothetical protein n=1 Tax=Micromonospora sp. CA-259024 TaxID=3239965 RepID=UPI003D8B865C